jgi:hypothetical protein
MTLVFTYGPETLQSRMYDRVGPSDLLGTAVLAGWRLVFNKPNHKNKDEGLANLEADDTASTFGLVYDLKPAQATLLEGFFGGYEARNLRVTLIDPENPDSKIVKTAAVYVARRTQARIKASAANLEITKKGMEENGADPAFIEALKAFE